MSRRNSTKNKKTLTALSLACVSALAFCSLAGCGSSSAEDDSSTTTKTDKETIANGNFEYYTDDNNLSIIVSPSGWSKSVGTDSSSNSASSSTKSSGIINTEKSKWENLTQHTDKYLELTEGDKIVSLADIRTYWKDTFNVADRLAIYEAITGGDYKNDTSSSISKLSEFEFYSDYKYSIDSDDIPDCDNPGTRNGISSDEDAENSVLMIHNYRTDGYGTAQKYTSSTKITVPANTSATFSVWVKTSDLKYNNGSDVNGNRGAYIGVTNTVGGVTLDQMQIKNIDTSSVTTNNGWAQYTIYLKGCSYASTTFNVVLGLGQGSSTNRLENVQGYAFFDDVTCEYITNEEYDAAVASGVPSCSTLSSTNEKLFDVSGKYAGKNAFALNLYQDFSEFDIKNHTKVELTKTETILEDKYYTTSGANAYKGLGFPTDNDYTGVATLSELESVDNYYLNSIIKKDFDKFPFGYNEDVLMIMSANKAAYTAEMRNVDSFSLEPGEKKAYSFWTKTSALNGYTGASITLVDGENESTIAAFDSTTVNTVDVGDKKDIYDGWVQCFFFVQNETDDVKTFYLKFTYGPTTITGTTSADYLEGYAAFTAFRECKMNSTEFSYAATGTYAVSASLTGDYKDLSGTGFDIPIYSDKHAIETGVAIPLNYTGVTGGSYYVGGSEECKADSNANAGLINKTYADAYYDSDTEWVKVLTARAEDSSLTQALSKDTWWSEIFGNSAQPLIIANVVEQSYGYVATSESSFSASSYTAIVYDVTVSPGAIAYVYLIDTSNKTKGYKNNVTLKTPEITYWYDDDGNVLFEDPSDEKFDGNKAAKKNNIAYQVNENGLYENAKDADDKTLYANLKAFKTAYENDPDNYTEGTDEGNNLVNADGNVVFYYKDGKYYAQYDEANEKYLLEVSDFPETFTAAYARYAGETKELYTVIDNRAGSQIVKERVAYYIATGDKSISYRLEFFSGSRDGLVKSNAGSFVAFDKVNVDVSSSYGSLLEEAINKISDDKTNGVTLNKKTGRLETADGKTYSEALYYTYTFYDSEDFVRYDAYADPKNGYKLYDDADEDPGNLYLAYKQSEQSESLIYLKDGYTTFVDYNATDKTVDADSTSDTDDDTTESSGFGADFWMMFASIALLAALLFTMAVLAAKRISENIKRKKLYKASLTPKRKTFKKRNTEESSDASDENKAE